MRIVIDGRLLDVRKTGGTQYTRGLIDGLAAAAPDHELLVLRRQADEAPRLLENVQQLVLPEAVLGDERWEQLRLPVVLRELRPDVYLAATSVATAVRCCPTAVVVYDLGFLLHPEFYAPSLRQYLRKWVPPSARNADAVIVMTEQVRDEVVRLLEAQEERTHVVPGAADGPFREAVPEDRIEGTCRSLGLRQPFVLCVSSSEANKNLPRLIGAYALARSEAAEHWQLVLAGPAGAAEPQVQAALAALDQREVVRLGFIPDEDLPALFRACSVFAFPSTFEGFGLPALEAMAAGRPVLCSDSGAVAEVVGDGALTVDAQSTEALAAGLSTLMSDASVRDELSARAQKRAAEFTWEGSGKRLLDVLEHVARK